MRDEYREEEEGQREVEARSRGREWERGAFAQRGNFWRYQHEPEASPVVSDYAVSVVVDTSGDCTLSQGKKLPRKTMRSPLKKAIADATGILSWRECQLKIIPALGHTVARYQAQLRCLSPISYRKSDIDVTRNVDVLWIHTEITGVTPLPPAKSWTTAYSISGVRLRCITDTTDGSGIGTGATNTVTCALPRHLHKRRNARERAARSSHTRARITSEYPPPPSQPIQPFSNTNMHSSCMYITGTTTRAQTSHANALICLHRDPVSRSGSPRAGQNLRDGGETPAGWNRDVHIFARFFVLPSLQLSLSFSFSWPFSGSVFFPVPLRASLLRQQLLLVFTGCLDRGAATGLRGHGWKFRRRSNPQLGGSRERQGSLGCAGWHRWRLGEKYQHPVSAQPLWPSFPDNGATLPLRARLWMETKVDRFQ